MSNKSSVKKNFFYQIIYELLVLILPFITSPYIARVLGAEGLGIYSYSYSIAYYFVLFSMLGLKNYGNRAIAQARDNENKLNRTFSSILVIHIITSLICCAVYLIYVCSLEQDKVYAAIQGAFVLSGLFDISWFYFGIEEFKLTVTRNTIIKILNVACVFLLVKDSDDLWKYCAIMAVGMLVSQLTLWIPLRKYVRIVKIRMDEVTIHLKPLFILFIPAIAVSLYKYMDKIMIGSMSSKTQLGYYENAEKVINIPMTIIASFGTVMLPKMSNLATSTNKKESMRYIALSMEFVMCLAFALAFGLAGVGKTFAPVFWGDGFSVSGTIIMGLAVTIPFVSFANVIRTQYLIPNKKDNEYLAAVIAGAIANLVVNWTLIPNCGAFGATIGTIVAEVTVCIIQSYVVRNELPLLRYFKSFFTFIVYGALMFIFVYFLGKILGTSIETLLLQIVVGAIVYCALSLITFIIEKNEIVMEGINRFKRKLSQR
ncbi:flippase [Enterocloster clostridioformis]|uniref:flippase n=1 Tax=Enterocloster clostridioformis TaxID=1531 RepID=UPI000414CC4B|nr:flippase [Enterocloster clostridioformis]